MPGSSRDAALVSGLDRLLAEGRGAELSPDPVAFPHRYADPGDAEAAAFLAASFAFGSVRQIGSFARFLEIAGRVNGQVVNVSAVARDAGVARQTVQDFFQILIDTLMGSWLPAWKLKRATKQTAHPKFYLFDPGVARHLAGLGHLPVHPEERRFLFETYLIHEIRAFLHYRGLDDPLFYFRTHDGIEVDLVLETSGGIVAIEMKSAERWERKFGSGLLRFRDIHTDRRVTLLGIYRGKRAAVEDGVRILPWKEALRLLWDGELLGGTARSRR